MKTTHLKSVVVLVALVACSGMDGSGAPVTNPNRSGTMIYTGIEKLYAVNMATNKTRLALKLPVIDESLGGIGLGPKAEIALAYNSSTTGPNSRITLYKADGSIESTTRHKHMITTNPKFNLDGSKLAYTASFYDKTNTKQYAVQVVSRDGTELFYYSNARSPSWLPDGRLVYKSLKDENLYLSDTDYSQPSSLIPNTQGAGAPDVSPDGSRIVFSQGNSANNPRRIYMVNLDGSARRQVTTSQYGEETLAVFSPNGKELLVSSYACVSAGSGPPGGSVESDVLHVIPASATMQDIPIGTRSGAPSEQRDESGSTRCSYGAPSWR
jgi:Tol biopolymer transport system component